MPQLPLTEIEKRAERVDLKGWWSEDENVGSQLGHAQLEISSRHPGVHRKEVVIYMDLDSAERCSLKIQQNLKS